MSYAFLASGISYLLLPLGSATSLLTALCALVGFGFGTLFAASAPLLVERFGLGRFGQVMELTFTAYGALGPVASGFLLDISQGGFKFPFFYLGGLCFASALLVWSSFRGIQVPLTLAIWAINPTRPWGMYFMRTIIKAPEIMG